MANNPPKTARAIPPNAGLAAWYERQLKALVRHMAAATEREVKANYKKFNYFNNLNNNLNLGKDEAVKPEPPPAAFAALLEAIFKRMRVKFDDAGRLMAERLARKVGGYTLRNIAAAMKEAGLTVEMKLTAREVAIMQNVVKENVDLIKSIPERYFDRVREAVGESVAAGRDLGGLAAALKKDYAITDRRAAMIARDQNNKATMGMSKARYQELGIKKAIWRHTAASKVHRPTHAAMDGQEFDLDEGLFDPKEGRNIWPGELVNCNCRFRAILPALGGGA